MAAQKPIFSKVPNNSSRGVYQRKREPVHLYSKKKIRIKIDQIRLAQYEFVMRIIRATLFGAIGLPILTMAELDEVRLTRLEEEIKKLQEENAALLQRLVEKEGGNTNTSVARKETNESEKRSVQTMGSGQAKSGLSQSHMDQQMFVQIISQYTNDYNSAGNELQKSVLRDRRKQALASAFPSPTVDDWIGAVDSLSTDGSGKARVILAITRGIKIWTKEDIEKDDPLYQSLFNLKVGQRVKFSGRFLDDKKDQDYFRENSFTESGAMKEPEFWFVFSSIQGL